jgi:hypothetical protein
LWQSPDTQTHHYEGSKKPLLPTTIEGNLINECGDRIILG